MELRVRRELFYHLLCYAIFNSYNGAIRIPQIQGWTVDTENNLFIIAMERIDSICDQCNMKPIGKVLHTTQQCNRVQNIIRFILVTLEKYGVFHNDLFNSGNLFLSDNELFPDIIPPILIDFGETAFRPKDRGFSLDRSVEQHCDLLSKSGGARTRRARNSKRRRKRTITHKHNNMKHTRTRFKRKRKCIRKNNNKKKRRRFTRRKNK